MIIIVNKSKSYTDDDDSFSLNGKEYNFGEKITLTGSEYFAISKATIENNGLNVSAFDIDVIDANDEQAKTVPKPEIESKTEPEQSKKEQKIHVEINMADKIAEQLEIYDVLLDEVSTRLYKIQDEDASIDEIAKAATAIYEKVNNE